MKDSLFSKIIFNCFLCISTSLFGHEDTGKNSSTQKIIDIQQGYGNWYTKELGSSTNILPSSITKSNRIITSEDLKNLKEYINDTQFSGVVYLSDEKNTYKICSEKFETMKDDELVFAIHSIGKVYTEILTLIMLQSGVIEEDILFSPLEVDSFSLQFLPPSVQQQMRMTTLHDTMIHKGGFSDYLGNYIGFIQKSLDGGISPPVLQKPEDFLPFADGEIFKVEPSSTHYSNLGILLVGLSIQHHYQKIEPHNYNTILKNHILDKAEIESFFYSKPIHGHFNENDPVAEYICGSPAGGYWTTAKDLHKFGEWIRRKCMHEPDFMNLIEKYGQEFYSTTNREILHGGGIPSSSAFLSVFLDAGITIAIVSDKNNQATSRSSHLYNAIVRNILAP